MTISQYLRNRNSEEFILGAVMDNLALYQAIDTEEKLEKAAGSLYNYFVGEWVRKNQYLELSKDDCGRLMDAYRKLIADLAAARDGAGEDARLRASIQRHRRRLLDIIGAKNELDGAVMPCAEYSHGLQEAVLHLDVDGLREPILDIGCGRSAALVRHLLDRGKEAYGIDQYAPAHGNILKANWLDYAFLPEAWGTAISHMAFTNHFRRAINGADRSIAKYEDKYLEILGSLKPGGRFIHCPRIPEIEDRIDHAAYRVEIFGNAADDESLDAVHVVRVGA